MRRTLRGRVSLLGLCVIASWVVVLAAGFGWAMRARLNAERDTVVRTRATTVAATVFINPRGELSLTDHRGDEVLDSGIWVYSGRTAIERPGGDARLQTAADAVAVRGHGYSHYGKYRLYAQPLTQHGTRVGAVVAAVSETPYEHAFRESLEGLAIFAFLLLLGAYPVLRLTTGRALNPVDSMTHQAADWSAHHLNERFGPDQRFRELQSLAITLDAVLDRLGAVVRHERRLPAELSHELRTPLARIVAEVDLLIAQPYSAQDADSAHRSIRESALSMNQILETLLSAARLDVNEAPGRCELGPVIEALLRPRADSGIRIQVQLSPGLAVGADGSIVARIIAPILENAHRYAQESVLITAALTSNSVLIDIGDDGPGIPTALRDAVFEPGRRIAVHDGHDGAGLGLALARRLARSVGGDVYVVDPGSRFQVRLPPG